MERMFTLYLLCMYFCPTVGAPYDPIIASVRSKNRYISATASVGTLVPRAVSWGARACISRAISRSWASCSAGDTGGGVVRLSPWPGGPLLGPGFSSHFTWSNESLRLLNIWSAAHDWRRAIIFATMFAMAQKYAAWLETASARSWCVRESGRA